jgi:hypothetical protein
MGSDPAARIDTGSSPQIGTSTAPILRYAEQSVVGATVVAAVSTASGAMRHPDVQSLPEPPDTR